MDLNHKSIFEKWVQTYSDVLYSRAIFRTSNTAVAEDLVQETFFAAYNSVARFRNESDPKTWLIRILNNKISDYFRDYYRKQRDRTFSIDHYYNSEKEIADSILHSFEEEQNIFDDPLILKNLQNYIEQLPPLWNQVVRLKYAENKRTNEICSALSIRPSNYWQILHRARHRLREDILREESI